MVVSDISVFSVYGESDTKTDTEQSFGRVVVDFILESDLDSIDDVDADELEESLSKKLNGDFMGVPIIGFETKLSYLSPVKLVR
jgi:hypothetical protein